MGQFPGVGIFLSITLSDGYGAKHSKQTNLNILQALIGYLIKWFTIETLVLYIYQNKIFK